MNFPYYRDFYPKIIMPIGMKDTAILQNSPLAENGATHWLIALQGDHDGLPAGCCSWKVMVFTSDPEGSFNWEQPYFASPVMESIESAIELAQQCELFGKNDELCSIELDKKIS
ncbi:hypothetical protein D1B31_22320 [Neobacillus notoginsengisoli]|uniref:Uncharacterized protein n=1 Tax=Neobacillus notoginsengisoli TaxID=1578198 RepID=A0A417YFC5_9BACI|nr:hypothetical protein [Neobacillus notoginsengisoli]RHW31418.1 hypothetical protein D1B31_22320 [Neobacillus notoginsengisoli]